MVKAKQNISFKVLLTTSLFLSSVFCTLTYRTCIREVSNLLKMEEKIKLLDGVVYNYLSSEKRNFYHFDDGIMNNIKSDVQRLSLIANHCLTVSYPEEMDSEVPEFHIRRLFQDAQFIENDDYNKDEYAKSVCGYVTTLNSLLKYKDSIDKMVKEFKKKKRI